MRSKLIAVLVSASLAATATAAPAQSAQPLSLARAPAATQARQSDLGGRRSWTPLIVGLAVVAAVVFIIVGLNKDHPLPDSP